MDLIDRQAAIDTIEHYLKHPPKNHSELFVQGMDDAYYRTLSILRTVPSAQPEIIYCKDCKWKNIHNCTRAVEVFIDDDKYCAWAERMETDER